jgi:hypothetical protein
MSVPGNSGNQLDLISYWRKGDLKFPWILNLLKPINMSHTLMQNYLSPRAMA